MTENRPWVQAAAVPDPDLLCTVCAEREAAPPSPMCAHCLCSVCAIRQRRAPSLMCGPCFAYLRRNISVLVGAHIWLGVAMLSPTPASKPGTIHRSAESSLPFRAELHDARVLIAARLSSWARVVCEEHMPALAGPADGQPETVGRWLADPDRLRWISDQPFCEPMAAELAETAQAAYALVPWGRHRQDLALPCPTCNILALSLYGGDEVIMCRNLECCQQMTRGEYDVLLERWRAENPSPETKPSTSLEAA